MEPNRAAKGRHGHLERRRARSERKSAAAYSSRFAKPRHLPLISNPVPELAAELGKMLLLRCPAVFLECLIRSRGVSGFCNSFDQIKIPQFIKSSQNCETGTQQTEWQLFDTQDARVRTIFSCFMGSIPFCASDIQSLNQSV